MSAILLDRDLVHYEVLGRGRPLVFLHGWVGSWRYWISAMQAASISHRTYALDLWGFGDSTKRARNYPFEKQVWLVDRFLDQMGIVRCILIGHGLGAIVAALFALERSEFVERLMLVAYPMENGMLSSRVRNLAPGELTGWLLGHTHWSEPVLLEAPKADEQAANISFIEVDNFNLADKRMKISKACLFVHGQSDPAIEPPRLEQLATLPEQAHAVLFEESGHYPMLDESSKFNRLLTDFLALAPGESPRDLQIKEEWKRRVR